MYIKWVSEKEAAVALGYSSIPRFRLNVKQGIIPVRWRCTNGRLFQYDIQDIRRFQDVTSSNPSTVKV